MKNRSTLERELRELREKNKALETQAAADPFSAPVKDATPAQPPPPPQEAAAAVEQAAEPSSVPSSTPTAPSVEPVGLDGPADEGETPPLGIAGARALAPGYYGVINFGTKLLVKRAPAFKDKPAEAARVARAVALDGSGHYDAAGNLVSDSADRQAIDPALIPVLAKVRLTPEWALLIVTGGILAAKYAIATGDEEILEAVAAMQGMGSPPAEENTPVTPADAPPGA